MNPNIIGISLLAVIIRRVLERGYGMTARKVQRFRIRPRTKPPTLSRQRVYLAVTELDLNPKSSGKTAWFLETVFRDLVSKKKNFRKLDFVST